MQIPTSTKMDTPIRTRPSRIKPDWLKIELPKGEKYLKLHDTVKNHGLHTICSSGKCPNMGECWSRGTATFMILGNICTRACKFCSVNHGKAEPVNENEPNDVAKSIQLMNLNHAVVTSVDRDDLEDKGASFWATTILKIKEMNPNTTLETLIPDFDGNHALLDVVLAAKPEIISHNMETVKRLTPIVRSRAKYDISLEVIRYISASGIRSKSGIMLGLGETELEILETMDDLRKVECKILTIGQYLQPTREQMPVEEYITPEKFNFYKEEGLKRGFTHVESGPLVRSSYHAENQI